MVQDSQATGLYRDESHYVIGVQASPYINRSGYEPSIDTVLIQVLNKVTSHHHLHLFRSDVSVSASNFFLGFFFSSLTNLSFDAPAAGFPLGATAAAYKVSFPSTSSERVQEKRAVIAMLVLSSSTAAPSLWCLTGEISLDLRVHVSSLTDCYG